MDNDDGHPVPTSEVGSDRARIEGEKTKTDAEKLLNSMESLLSRILTTHQTPTVSTSYPTQFLPFDPDDPESDIDGWCNVTEAIVQNKRLEGIDLLMALTSALKGRAAACITKLKVSEMSWSIIKQTLLAKFSKPKLLQEYFDEILNFQIGTKETAAESALRLWSLIEKIPLVTMPEEVVTGFVISVLCQKDGIIRRELNAHNVTTRAHLFRILGGVSLKRRIESGDTREPETKRFRTVERFNGRCNFCGISGHRYADCRKRRDDTGSVKSQDTPSASRVPDMVTCYACGQKGHVATSCPERKNGGKAVVKEVQHCEHRPSRGILATSSGESAPFLFDSGSSCSLVKESYYNKLSGTECKNLVYLSGIGGDDIQCNLQIQGKVKIGNQLISLLFHVVPDDSISEPIIIGRDILDLGLCVKIDNDSLLIYSKEESHFCDSISCTLDLTQIDTDLQGRDKDMLIAILMKYSNHFVEGIPTKRVKTGVCEIRLVDPHKVVYRCPSKRAPIEKQIIREKIQELLNAGVIRESSSPFASPIVLVKKKDNSDRLCVDFRELNSNTVPEHYPMPRIDDQIDQLTGANFFSSLDMASGFHQIPIHPDSIEKTAFVTNEGQYEYLAMPFGLRNAPSVFQRCITKALSNLRDKPLIYMDDILCHSVNISEGLQRLDSVLGSLSEAGFSFNLKKCKFLKQKVDYLGYSLQSGEIRPNSRKIQALVDAPEPKTATNVRQFLGLASYFRKFIPNYTRIVGPLYPLTKLKGRINWTAEHEKIRHNIIQILTSEPVLTIFDPELPVELHTDASSEGYGAILLQRKNNLLHVVEYFSRRTSETESRYHSYELETLAVVRAVEHFRQYLYGRRFLVVTDCNSLKASKSKKDLTPRVYRWWAYLQAYDFDIVYREGSKMEHADYLSRNPVISCNVAVTTLAKKQAKTINYIELHQGWLAVEQKRDSEIQDLIAKYHNNSFPETVAQTYDIREGILYRKIIRNKVVSWLPVVPRSLIWTLINHVHNELQHLGRDKTLDKLYEKYWFPDMSKCVRKFIDSCIICRASKGPSGAQPVQLHPIPKAPVPWHTIHIDFTGKLSGKSDRKEYCSVIIDAFTKYVLLEHAYAVDTKSAINAVQKAVYLFGAPKRIIVDQGRCFISSDFKTFCNEHKIELHFIATGSSRANGQVERVMRTLKSLLTIIENDPNKTWRDELGNIQLALNSTKSTVTKYSPSEIMFGIRSNSLGMSKLNVDNSDHEIRLDLDTVREDASANIQKAAKFETARFNRGRATVIPFAKGEFVFIKNCERNKTKLDRKFRGPFVITEVLDNDRYELKSVGGSQRLYKYSHENLRAVPRGHDGLLEVATSILNQEEAETASEGVEYAISSNHENEMLNDSDTLTVCSETASADSCTFTASSNTFTSNLDPNTWEVSHEVEIHTEQDDS
ncbi:unnamed protein product [Euphydryas editha]|uniref:RNA-directed DNA polymerase n=1 Tax=Euphydryas editha TaxID=104508 RepID=A0AAU9V4W0_EUPED|nr:unnamed protein product [Euphydryas editha]